MVTTDADGGTIDSPAPLRESAYRGFMNALLAREFRPGRLISQREIAARTGSSLTSVREALKRLEGERIVELLPKRGILIREVRRADIAQAYDARLLIEDHAIGTYARHCDRQQVEHFLEATRIAVSNRPADQAEELEHFDRRIRLDRDLHRTIVAALRNGPLASAHATIETTMLLARLNLPPLFHSRGPAFDEHLVLLEALRERDVRGARRSLREHLLLAKERALHSAEP